METLISVCVTWTVMGLENRIVFDIVDGCSIKLKQALIKDKGLKVYTFAGGPNKEKTAVSAHQMKTLCYELKKEFDFVLVDCPAGIEQGFKNAIAGADEAIVVAVPEVSSVRDADRIVGLLEAAGLRKNQLIINRIRPRMVKRGDMMDIEDMIDILSVDLLGVVPEDEIVIVSTNKGEPVVIAPASRAGDAYRRIARRLNGEEVSLLPLDHSEGLVNRFRRMFKLASR